MSRAPAPSAAGFSLPELMIALALGAGVIAALLSAHAQARSLYERAQRLARLNEKALYALSVLEPDVQLAGYYGLATSAASLRLTMPGAAPVPASALRSGNPPATGLPAGAQRCGSHHALDVLAPIAASDGRYPLACAALEGGAVEGSDTLSVRRAAARPAPADAARLQLATSRLAPGRQWIRLGLPAAADDEDVRDLQVHTYYVATHSLGAADDAARRLPALRVKTLTSVAGAPAFIDTEVLSGIEDLQVELGYAPTATAGSPRFVGADELPRGAEVLAVRLWLRIVAEEEDRGFRDPREYRYAGRRFTAADERHRLLVSRTVRLRNARAAR